MPQFKYDWGFLLREINFQTDSTDFGLQGIQFVFNNDRKSDMFSAGNNENLEISTIFVDQWSEIRHVQMLIVSETGVIEGIRLLDDDELAIHEVIWGQ